MNVQLLTGFLSLLCNIHLPVLDKLSASLLVLTFYLAVIGKHGKSGERSYEGNQNEEPKKPGGPLPS